MLDFDTETAYNDPMTNPKRYYVHDTQGHIASHMQRNTAINPRYWVIDRTTNLPVDEATTKRVAIMAASDLNKEI
jgi:hypothetical protein